MPGQGAESGTRWLIATTRASNQTVRPNGCRNIQQAMIHNIAGGVSAPGRYCAWPPKAAKQSSAQRAKSRWPRCHAGVKATVLPPRAARVMICWSSTAHKSSCTRNPVRWKSARDSKVAARLRPTCPVLGANAPKHRADNLPRRYPGPASGNNQTTPAAPIDPPQAPPRSAYTSGVEIAGRTAQNHHGRASAPRRSAQLVCRLKRLIPKPNRQQQQGTA